MIVMLNIKAMEDKPRWEELCRQTSVEQDPEKHGVGRRD